MLQINFFISIFFNGCASLKEKICLKMRISILFPNIRICNCFITCCEFENIFNTLTLNE